MKDLITLIAKALVDQPEEVQVREVGGNHTKVLELEVAKADIGKIIGRRGRTAQAMRIILGAASARADNKAILEILD